MLESETQRLSHGSNGCRCGEREEKKQEDIDKKRNTGCQAQASDVEKRSGAGADEDGEDPAMQGCDIISIIYLSSFLESYIQEEQKRQVSRVENAMQFE